jgi:hypothetical protein
VSVHASHKKRAIFRQIDSVTDVSEVFESGVLAELLADETGGVVTLGVTPHDLEKISVHMPLHRCDVREKEIDG